MTIVSYLQTSNVKLLTSLAAAVLLFAPVTASAECAWPVMANRETLNVAFPDTASTYWSYRYRVRPGTEIEISGQPIRGRYFSLNTYSYRGVNLDGVADAELGAAPGGATAPAAWRVILRGGVRPGAQPGVLAATADAADSGFGVLIYRVYVPDDAADALAGAPLPTLTIRRDGEAEVLEACEHPGRSLLVELFLRAFAPRPTEPVRARPVFIRPASAEGFFPNRDNKYLAALTTWAPGRVAVVRGKAPAVPDDLRYWSFCSNEYRLPYPVVACHYDRQVTLDAQGNYTFVISRAADRPANATREAGVNWLPWGSTEEVNILLLRNMQPATEFAHAIQRVTPGERGAKVMGAYYPQVWYCTRERFERHGADGCRSTAPK